MTVFFAKTKRAGAVCAVMSAVMIAIAVFALCYSVGNFRCALDAPVLISEDGGAVFIGYYLLTYAYAALAVIALLLCALFAANAVKTLKK